MPNQKNSSIKGMFGKYYNLKSGVQPYNLGKASTVLGTGLNAYQYGKSLTDRSKAENTTRDLAADIVTASRNNPMVQYDLDSDQLALLRKLKRGNYEVDDDFDLSNIAGGAINGALMGAPGGIPGMILGAVGGGVNAYSGDRLNAQNAANDELEALYAAIMQSEKEYNDIRKQRALQGYF